MFSLLTFKGTTSPSQSPSVLQVEAAMAELKNPTNAATSTLFSFLLLSSMLCGALSAPAAAGHHAQQAGFETRVPMLPVKNKLLYSQEPNREVIWKSATSSRRMLIGSRAPICTFNECRGCRFKCTAEQVPVDANDPMNSAYHYKCVCHR